MYLITVNTGSSSVKIGLFDYKTLKEIDHVHIEKVSSYDRALETALRLLEIEDKKFVKVVAHRVVHGGKHFHDTTLITKSVERKIDELKELAPLHNPINLKGIEAAKKIFKCPHFAVFDTAFYQPLPLKAKLYGLPYQYYEKDDIQRYGFHGINHKYVYYEACSQLDQTGLTGITCHLGNGCSITLTEKGKPRDTSMGFTPLEGLIMGTRSGDIDPAIIFYLKSRYGRLNIERMLQERSGLLGLSGVSSHMREIFLAAKNKKNQQARTAIDTFCYHAAKYIATYAGLVPKLDFIAFTGGIGERAGYVRRKILNNLPGVKYDHLLVINANEAYQMALEAKEKLNKAN